MDKDENYRKSLLKKLHTIFGLIGITKENKLDIYAAYGVESARDLKDKELIELIDKLEEEKPDLDKLRKQVIAAIGGYYRKINKAHDIKYIKETAERAAGGIHFNKISEDRLRKIMYEFNNKVK